LDEVLVVSKLVVALAGIDEVVGKAELATDFVNFVLSLV